MNAIYSALYRLTSPLAVAAVLAFAISVADRLIGLPEAIDLATMITWVGAATALLLATLAFERLDARAV